MEYLRRANCLRTYVLCCQSNSASYLFTKAYVKIIKELIHGAD